MVLDANIPAQVRIEMTTGMCLLIKNHGIELVQGRLSWSGLTYLLARDIINFAYDIRIGAPA